MNPPAWEQWHGLCAVTHRTIHRCSCAAVVTRFVSRGEVLERQEQGREGAAAPFQHAEDVSYGSWLHTEREPTWLKTRLERRALASCRAEHLPAFQEHPPASDESGTCREGRRSRWGIRDNTLAKQGLVPAPCPRDLCCHMGSGCTLRMVTWGAPAGTPALAGAVQALSTWPVGTGKAGREGQLSAACLGVTLAAC